MRELVFIGRGGQGVVTIAELFAKAAACEGKNVQSVPHFGAERRGAQVVSYARVSDDKIWLREPVTRPDVLTVLDQSVIKENKIIDTVKPGGVIVLNTARPPEDIGLGDGFQIFVVDATGIALKILGRPIVSAVILGTLSRATGIITMNSIRRAIERGFPGFDTVLTMQAVDLAASSTLQKDVAHAPRTQ